MIGVFFLISLASFYILGTILGFVNVGVVHLFVKLYGGEGKYSDSYRAAIYGSTPAMLLFFIVPITGIWSLVLNIFGLSVNHNITKLRAFLAIFSAFLLYGVLSLGVVLILVMNGVQIIAPINVTA